MLRILKGSFGSPIVIDYVILETVTLLNQRKIHAAIRSFMKFLRENKFTIFITTEQVFNEAIEMTIKSETDFLSLSDSSQIVVSKALDIQQSRPSTVSLVIFLKHVLERDTINY